MTHGAKGARGGGVCERSCTTATSVGSASLVRRSHVTTNARERPTAAASWRIDQSGWTRRKTRKAHRSANAAARSIAALPGDRVRLSVRLG